MQRLRVKEYHFFGETRISLELSSTFIWEQLTHDGIDPQNIEQPIILPSSFTGSPHYMAEKPKCNVLCPQIWQPWPFRYNPEEKEVQKELVEHQDEKVRNDLVARVFHENKKLMWLLQDEKIFWKFLFGRTQLKGKNVVFLTSTLSFGAKKGIRPNDVDKIISAELPDKVEDQHCLKRSIRGPCGQLNPRSCG
jgi:hypothetical protein